MTTLQHNETNTTSRNLWPEPTKKIIVHLFWFWNSTLTIVLCLWIFSLGFGNEWLAHFRSLLFGFCIVGVICLAILILGKKQWDKIEKFNFFVELAYTGINIFLLIVFNATISGPEIIAFSRNVSWIMIVILALLIIFLWHAYLGFFELLKIWAAHLAHKFKDKFKEFWN